MNSDDSIDLNKIILKSREINSRVIKLIRIIILLLTYYIKDGVQYREFKSFLDISDGKLHSNLEILEEMGYLRKTEVSLDQKSLHIYLITQLGKKELEKIISWISNIKKFIRGNEDV
ncbi:MAG: transcriptional regulator [Candidatus Lokiarchaeota archaeon]|nr:transcriptional regulator [Candidatus Lokiarchaeota archaeon]